MLWIEFEFCQHQYGVWFISYGGLEQGIDLLAILKKNPNRTILCYIL